MVCCDVDARKAGTFAVTYGFDSFFTNVDEMIEAVRPDCLFVATPVTVTTDLAIHLSRYKIPLMIEKPPALTFASGKKLCDALEKNSVQHQVAFNRHFMPIITYLKKDLEERTKTIQSVHALMSRFQRVEETFHTTAIHSIDLARFLAGSEYKEIHFSYQDLPRYGNHVSNIFMDYVFQNGISGQSSLLVCSGTTNERVMMTCDDTTYFAHLPMWDCDDVPGMLQCNENNSLAYIKRGEELGPTYDYMINGFYYQIAHFISSVESGKQPEESMAYALQSVHIAEYIGARKNMYRNF